MASLLSSMPPRTHCSAATSCGGVRSKPPPVSRGGGPAEPPPGPLEGRASARVSSVTDTAPPPIDPTLPHIQPPGYDRSSRPGEEVSVGNADPAPNHPGGRVSGQPVDSTLPWCARPCAQPV